jgi:hypothetical protein
MKKLAIAMVLLAAPAMAQQGTYSGSSIPDIKVEGKECKPVAVVNGVLLWAGDCGKPSAPPAPPK